MKILIVEDSRLARTELVQQLRAIDSAYDIEQAANIQQAQKLIEAKEYDLFLLDIEMPGGNGFELLDKVENFPAVIFVTAYDQYAIQSFEYGAVDYLLKPVTETRLRQALERISPVGIQSQSLSMDSQVFLKHDERCLFVKLKDIFAFESIGNYTRVHLQHDKPMIYRSLSNLESRLPPSVFFRSSRSWIVNTQQIQSIEPSVSQGLDITLNNGLELDISRRQSSRFKKLWAL